MEPGRDAWELARDLRERSRRLVELLAAGDASAIALASPAEFACADELAKQEQTKDRPSWDRGQSRNAAFGLAKIALDKDFGDGLVAVCSRPEWVASRSASRDDMRKAWVQMGAMAADRHGLDCVKALSRVSIENAWTMATLCAPIGKEEEGRFEGVGRSGKTAKEGWAEGFAAALAVALAQGAAAPGEALAGSEALFLAANGKWSKDEGPVAFEAALSTAEALLAAKALDERGTWAALRLALESGHGRDRILAVAIESARHKHLDLSKAPPARLGLPSSPRRMGECACWFGQEMHPAWAAAAKASSADAGVAERLVKLLGQPKGEGPSVAPSVEGLAHPLAAVWDVWNSSCRAGRALPAKPLEVARSRLLQGLKGWTGRVSSEEIDAWREGGLATLNSLAAGKIPADVGGWTTKPDTEEIKTAMSSRLSPLAWRMGQPGEVSIEDLVAVGRAQAALGYSVDSSMGQVEAMGVFLSTEAKAAMEKLALEQEIVAPEDLEKKTEHGLRL